MISSTSSAGAADRIPTTPGHLVKRTSRRPCSHPHACTIAPVWQKGRVIRAGGVIVVAGLVLAACSSGTKSGSAATQTTSTSRPAASAPVLLQRRQPTTAKPPRPQMRSWPTLSKPPAGPPPFMSAEAARPVEPPLDRCCPRPWPGRRDGQRQWGHVRHGLRRSRDIPQGRRGKLVQGVKWKYCGREVFSLTSG